MFAFVVFGINITLDKFYIYNRWGNPIFFTDDIHKGWNGTADASGAASPIGTYTYYVSIESESGRQKFTPDL